MKRFLIALQFLTILPLKIKSKIDPKEFGQSLGYFPLVGALIGSVLALSLLIFNFLPLPVVSTLILVISIIITGGIHLEGFADSCDGFYGGKSKEEILAIMRDSHLGAMGVIGLISLILLKFTLFMNIAKNNQGQLLIIMAAFARWVQSLSCLVSDYARQEGKAKYFIDYVSRKEVIIGGVFTLVLVLLLTDLRGLILLGASLIPVFIFIRYVKRKIKAMTGDTIGALNEIAEVSILLFFCF